MTEKELRELEPEEAGNRDDDDDEVGAFEGPWYAFPPMRNALIAGALLVAGWLVERFTDVPGYVPIGIFVLAIVVGAYYWVKEGLEEFVEEREIGIEALMAAATVGAVILGEWFEAAFLVFLFAGAEAVEEYTYARTRTAIRSLLDLAPETATRLGPGGEREEEVRAEELGVGEIFLIRPGERIPTDGEIVEGAGSLDESAVTGESVPVEKGEGAKVFAGTINSTGSLKVRATTNFESNSLQKIIHLVEEAQGVKSRAQRWIDRFGNRYSPAVLLGALLLLVVPPLLGGPFDTWAYRAVVLLVAAAPCALVMSTPVAIAAAIGRAGREGVLIKGGVHLENLAKLEVVAFDKTGTLTRGKPEVTDVIPADGGTQELLRVAATVERYSEHPLARAIVERARSEGLAPSEARGFEAFSGSGAKADLAGRTVYVGSPTLFRDLGVSPDGSLDGAHEEIERLQAEGKTVVLVGDEERVEGLLALRDEPRKEARHAIEELHGMGYRVAMLTGDNTLTANAIAKELGIDDVRADLKPEDKVEAVKGLEREYGPAAMVGDGINDSPALATASVGLAMGTAGTDAAIEAADVALMADDPGKAAYALRLARRSQRISLQNIVFSILVLAVLIPGAVLGLLGIAAAVFAHEASELLAVANGLRMAKRAA